MFGLFSSPNKAARDGAQRWLEVAQNVWHLRRDVIPEADGRELLARRDALAALLEAKAAAPAIEASVKRLDDQLKKTGGAVYPRGALKENVEFFVMAALVILGFRSYFFGNFEIPTNSMWPTFYGMTGEVYKHPADEPNGAVETLRRFLVGATPHRLNAPAAGEILIPISNHNDPHHGGFVHYRVVQGRSWFVFPAQKREYTLLVDNEPVRFQVPIDFDFDWVIYDAFLDRGRKFGPLALRENLEARVQAQDWVRGEVDGETLLCLHTGVHVQAGQRILSFDEEAGDKLFVDRVSYNFVRPPVGSGIVFRTGNIEDLVRDDGDVFFVKRLVGVPGDTLQVKGTTLYRNGAPITGSSAFAANSGQVGLYPGYESIGALQDGQSVTVPPHGFYAMGDNSPNSKDSRYWGTVPEKDVVGRPVFVYYPFTRRFGLAK